ELPPVKIHC
nr:Chain P, IscU recognition peptide